MATISGEEDEYVVTETGSEVIMFKWGSLQKPFRCQLCDMLFEDGAKLKEHIDKHLVNAPPSTKPFHCKICPKAFLSNKSLERHTQMHYGQVQKRCKFCYKTFANKENLERHILSHEGQKPHKCPQCPEQFVYRQGLETHMATHTGVRPFVCEVCNRGFNRKDILERHMDTHETKRKKYKCVECDKLFSHSFVLKRHTRAVHSEEFASTECPVCKKFIKCKENLIRHMQIHTGERPFSCEICSRQFRQKQHLTDHMVIHTGGKPHKCGFCEETFKHKRTLTRHLRKHDEHRPHQCSQCLMGFPEKSMLKKHLKKHDEKKYQCSTCHLLFKLRTSLRRHKQKVHNEDISDTEIDMAEGRELEISTENPTKPTSEKKIVIVLLKKDDKNRITTQSIQAISQIDNNNQIGIIENIESGQKFELVGDSVNVIEKHVSKAADSIAQTAEKISTQVAMETEVRMAAGQEFEEAMEVERSNIIQSLIEYAEREMRESKQEKRETVECENGSPRVLIENISFAGSDVTESTGTQFVEELGNGTQTMLEDQSATVYLEEAETVEESQMKTILVNSGDSKSGIQLVEGTMDGSESQMLILGDDVASNHTIIIRHEENTNNIFIEQVPNSDITE